ncbi:MAG TPA: GxxExxY protein [Chthoniobacterales bacterium]|nr:GxxExxY protein [Chthoniobacterales bacterium]
MRSDAVRQPPTCVNIGNLTQSRKGAKESGKVPKHVLTIFRCSISRDGGAKCRKGAPPDDGIAFDVAFKMDVLVNDLVILELKFVENLEPVHFKQLLTYLRLTGLRLGLLINFGEAVLKNGIDRIVNNL